MANFDYFLAKGTKEDALNLTLEEVKSLKEATWLVVPGTDPELLPVVIKSNLAQSGAAIRATSDYLGPTQEYNHPDTCAGFHAYKGADTSVLFSTDPVGVVHVNHDGSKAPVPNEYNSFMGWAQVDILNGVMMDSPLKDKRSKEDRELLKAPSNVLQAMKHSFVDALIKGYTLVIWIAHFGGKNKEDKPYIQGFLNQWEMAPDDAAEHRLNRIVDAQLVDHTVRLTSKRQYQRKQENGNGNGNGRKLTPAVPQVKDPETGEVTAAPMMIAVFGKSNRKNLMDVPAGDYQFASKTRVVNVHPIAWNPNDPETVEVWQSIIDEGLGIVLD